MKPKAKTNENERSVTRTRARAIDLTDLALRLFERQGVRQIAKETGFAPSSVCEAAKKPEVVEMVAQFQEWRAIALRREADAHMADVVKAWADAAQGKLTLDPLQAQLLLAYVGLTVNEGVVEPLPGGPRALPAGQAEQRLFPPNGTVIVNVGTKAEEVIEVRQS